MSLLGAGRSSWCGVWGSPSALDHTSPSHFLSSIHWPGARGSSLTLKLLRVSLRAEHDLELVEIPWGWNYWDSPALGELLSMLLTKIWVLSNPKVPLSKSSAGFSYDPWVFISLPFFLVLPKSSGTRAGWFCVCFFFFYIK